MLSKLIAFIACVDSLLSFHCYVTLGSFWQKVLPYPHMQEMLLLEWVDDIHMIETQSYGAAINYNIAAPLLHDITESLKQAASVTNLGHDGATASMAVARLMFAHCETLVPLASLIGLFRPSATTPPAPSVELLDAAVTPLDAQRHLQRLDSLEDLHMAVTVTEE